MMIRRLKPFAFTFIKTGFLIAGLLCLSIAILYASSPLLLRYLQFKLLNTYQLELHAPKCRLRLLKRDIYCQNIDIHQLSNPISKTEWLLHLPWMHIQLKHDPNWHWSIKIISPQLQTRLSPAGAPQLHSRALPSILPYLKTVLAPYALPIQLALEKGRAKIILNRQLYLANSIQLQGEYHPLKPLHLQLSAQGYQPNTLVSWKLHAALDSTDILNFSPNDRIFYQWTAQVLSQAQQWHAAGQAYTGLPLSKPIIANLHIQQQATANIPAPKALMPTCKHFYIETTKDAHPQSDWQIGATCNLDQDLKILNHAKAVYLQANLHTSPYRWQLNHSKLWWDLRKQLAVKGDIELRPPYSLKINLSIPFLEQVKMDILGTISPWKIQLNAFSPTQDYFNFSARSSVYHKHSLVWHMQHHMQHYRLQAYHSTQFPYPFSLNLKTQPNAVTYKNWLFQPHIEHLYWQGDLNGHSGLLRSSIKTIKIPKYYALPSAFTLRLDLGWYHQGKSTARLPPQSMIYCTSCGLKNQDTNHEVTLNAKWQFHPYLHWKGDFKWSHFPAEWLLQLWYMLHKSPLPIPEEDSLHSSIRKYTPFINALKTSFSGITTFSRYHQHFHITTKLTGTELKIFDFNWGNWQFFGEYKPNITYSYQRFLSLSKNKKPSLQWNWLQNNHYHRIFLKAQNHPLTWNTHAPFMWKGSGLFNAELAWSGSLTEIQGPFRINTQFNPSTPNIPLQYITWYGHSNHGKLNSKIAIQTTQTTQIYPVELFFYPPYHLKIQVPNTMTFFQGELGSGIPAQLQYKAEGEISGPLEEPSAIRLNFNLEHFSGKLKHIPFALIQPIRIHCHMGYCPLPMTLIQLHDLKNPLKIEGLLHSFYSFLHFHFSGDLDNLFYQIWGIPLYQAKLHSDIYWHYRPGHAHRFSGRFNLTHGRFQHLSDPTPFSDITLHASIHNQTLLIEHISGLHQKGYFKGEGECIFNGFHEPRLQLLIQTQQLKLQWGRDFIATISGNGSLSGPIYHLLAEGRFHVDHLIYSAPISLESFINRKDIKSSTGSFLPRFPLQLQLNLRFFAERHIFVQNHLLDAELGADLTFKGSLTHIGVLGSISKVNAVARYRDIAFKITRANISFTEEFRIFSVFFIEAEAQACNIHMRMNFHGNSDDYVVQPTGQDDQGPVSSQDIWSCLQFGLRLRDFDGNQSHHAGLSDALPGTLDTLWMVSGLQSQMNQILPTQLFDELRLTSAWSSKGMKSTPRIIIGKRLKTGVLLRYARSIDEYDEQALSLEYRLNRRTIFQSSYATQIYVPVGDFGLDLRLRWERD